MSARSLATILNSDQNSFNAVRLFAAIAVVVSHSYLLLLAGDHSEPLDWAPYNLGQIAVNVFFFLSGMMLSRSYALRPDWRRFALARILRVFPALIACGFVVAWVLGPLATTLSIERYFADPRTLLYPFVVPFLFDVATLPGIFQHGFNPGEVNAPLWTIKYELLAYLAFGIASALGLTQRRRLVLIATIVLGATLTVTLMLHTFEASPIGSFLRFSFCFALGATAFQYAEHIKMPPLLAAVGVGAAFALWATPIGAVASIIGFAGLALLLGGLDLGWLTRSTTRTDISFGLYLYAWPLQQMLLMLRDAEGPWGLALFALPLVGAMGVALASWHLIEKPALRLKHFRPAAQAASSR